MKKEDEIQQDIITVSEMARRVGLSRARFYELMAQGCFPQPSRNPKTNRPFFNREQQEQCLRVRKTHCGVNGKPVMFYGGILGPATMVKSKRPAVRPTGRSGGHKTPDQPILTQLRNGLGQLGIPSIGDGDLRSAMADCFPDGYRDVDPATLLRSVFDHLTRRNATDNLKR